MGRRNHVLDGSPRPTREGAILRGQGHPTVKYRDTLHSVVCAKTAAIWIMGLDGPKELC